MTAQADVLWPSWYVPNFIARTGPRERWRGLLGEVLPLRLFLVEARRHVHHHLRLLVRRRVELELRDGGGTRDALQRLVRPALHLFGRVGKRPDERVAGLLEARVLSHDGERLAAGGPHRRVLVLHEDRAIDVHD